MSWDTPSAFAQQRFPIQIEPGKLEIGHTEVPGSHHINLTDLDDANYRLNEIIRRLFASKGLSKIQVEDLAYELQEISQLIYGQLR